MAEYIDREALLKEIDEDYYPMNWTNSEAEIQADNDYALYKNVIEAQPTADVVEVVRCAKCKHWNKTDTDIIVNIDYGKCTNSKSPYHNEEETTGGDYCSYGERR